MTREETLAIMSVLKAAYPEFYKNMRRDEAEGIVNLWASIFTDDPAEVVAAAVKAFIATDVKGFAPKPGQIKASIVKVTQPAELEMSELEAWGMVSRAVSNGIYGSQKEFDKLPPHPATACWVAQPTEGVGADGRGHGGIRGGIQLPAQLQGESGT